jgi:hypothetical protein
MQTIRRLLGLIVGVALLALPGFAAEVSVRRNKSPPVAILTLEGEIVPGDAERVLGYIREAEAERRVVSTIRLRSPGGDVLEALKLSEMLNQKLITADAPSEVVTLEKYGTGQSKDIFDDCSTDNLSDTRNCICNSSCAIIWLTSAFRSGGYVGVHRPRFQESYFAGLGAEEAQEEYAELTKVVTSFLVENEAPPEIITKMMAVPSGKIHILTEEERGIAGEGKPYILELLHAKCSPYHSEHEMIQQLERRYEDLSRDFEAMANAGNYDGANSIGDKMEKAQTEFYEYRQKSQYTKCIYKEKWVLKKIAQNIPLTDEEAWGVPPGFVLDKAP